MVFLMMSRLIVLMSWRVVLSGMLFRMMFLLVTWFHVAVRWHVFLVPMRFLVPFRMMSLLLFVMVLHC